MHRIFSAHHDADSARLQGMEALSVQGHGLMIFPGMNTIGSQQGYLWFPLVSTRTFTMFNLVKGLLVLEVEPEAFSPFR